MSFHQCEDEIRAAYAALTVTMRRIGRDSKARPVLPDPEDVDLLMKQAACRCGAMVAAAVKRAKRRMVLEHLAASRLDITPTVALHCAQRLLGRGIDMRATLAAFVTPGRTAADKSAVTAEDLRELEHELGERLAALSASTWTAKEEIARAWRNSPERKAILADWAAQRAAIRRNDSDSSRWAGKRTMDTPPG